MSDVTHILESAICVIGNMVEIKTGLRPLQNSGDRYDNPTFSMHCYSWNEEEDQRWNFKCGNVEVSWYKYFGRGMSANREIWAEEALSIMARCLESLK